MQALGRWAGVAAGLMCSAGSLAGNDTRKQYLDTHIHTWSLPREDGSQFPRGCCGDLEWLNRDFGIDDYTAQLDRSEPVGIVLVESLVGVPAEDLPEGNRQMLEEARREPLIVGVVGMLDLNAPDFQTALEALSVDPLFLGLRMGKEILSEDDALTTKAKSALKTMAQRGLVMDTLQIHPLELAAVAEALPSDLRIVFNHFARKGERLDLESDWRAGIEAIAPYPNVYVKISDWQRMSASAVGGGWPVPFEGIMDADAYRPIFEFLMERLGPDRLLFGTNWPVSNIAGPMEQQIRILDTLLEDYPEEVADKLFRSNAMRVYRREVLN